MNDQRGFSTLAMMALLPLLISAFAVVAACYFIFDDDAVARHGCRLTLLAAQEQAGRDLNRLLEMNKGAKALRIARIQAEAAVIAAAAVPPAEAAAQAELQIVMEMQDAYAIAQKALIMKGKTESRLAPFQAYEKVSRALLRNRKNHTDSTHSATLLPVTKTGQFNVIAKQENTPTPDYEPSDNFRDEQETKLSWRLSIADFLPAWIKALVPTTTLTSRAECSATLEKENSEWQPRITADRR